MKPEIKAKWVQALRSGKYKQGKNALRNDNDEYCCLGVLCEISGLGNFRKSPEKQGAWIYLGEDKVLPSDVKDWAGVKHENPPVSYDSLAPTLAQLNDTDVPFNEIADIIEAQL